MWCLLLINLLFLKTIICANILIVNDMTSPSHQLWNFAYANGLLIKGHNVTMISPHLTENVNYTNFHQIHFEGNLIKISTLLYFLFIMQVLSNNSIMPQILTPLNGQQQLLEK